MWKIIGGIIGVTVLTVIVFNIVSAVFDLAFTVTLMITLIIVALFPLGALIAHKENLGLCNKCLAIKLSDDFTIEKFIKTDAFKRRPLDGKTHLLARLYHYKGCHKCKQKRIDDLKAYVTRTNADLNVELFLADLQDEFL